MAHRNVEILIGRLVSDEAFRCAFLANPALALHDFREAGHELTAVEVAAVLSTPRQLWRGVAERIDARLVKANLTNSRGRHGD